MKNLDKFLIEAANFTQRLIESLWGYNYFTNPQAKELYLLMANPQHGQPFSEFFVKLCYWCWREGYLAAQQDAMKAWEDPISLELKKERNNG